MISPAKIYLAIAAIGGIGIFVAMTFSRTPSSSRLKLLFSGAFFLGVLGLYQIRQMAIKARPGRPGNTTDLFFDLAIIVAAGCYFAFAVRRTLLAKRHCSPIYRETSADGRGMLSWRFDLAYEIILLALCIVGFFWKLFEHFG